MLLVNTNFFLLSAHPRNPPITRSSPAIHGLSPAFLSWDSRLIGAQTWENGGALPPRPPRCRNSIALAPPAPRWEIPFSQPRWKGAYLALHPLQCPQSEHPKPVHPPFTPRSAAWYFVFDVFLCSHTEFFFEAQ